MNQIKKMSDWNRENDSKAVILSVLAVSFVVYCYYFILEPFNSDTYNVGLLKYTGETAGVQLGCWASLYFYKLTGMIIHPVFNHIIYTLCIAASAVILNDLWEIRQRLIRILSGATLMIAPAVVGQMMYIYVYPTFGLAFFCSVISVYCFFRTKHLVGIILAIVFMTLSLGFYSIYFGALLFLGTGTLIMRLIEGKYASFREFLIAIVKCFGYILCGLILYYVMMELHFILYHTGRSSYAGGGDVGIKNTIMNVPTYLKSTYRQFVRYYRDAKLSANIFWSVLIFLTVICIIYQLRQMMKEKAYWSMMSVLFLLLVIPPCANVMLFIMPFHGLQLHWIYQLQLMAPFCVSIVEITLRGLQGNGEYNKYIQLGTFWLMVIIMAGLTISYGYQTFCSFRTVDIGGRYIKLYIQSAIIHAIEDDTYEEGMPIVFMGFVNDDPVQEKNPLREYSYYERASSFWGDRYEVFSTWPNYCWYNFGIDIGQVTPDQYDAILTSDEFKAMEQYPSDKAYSIINGCYVILMDRESVQE